MANTARLQFLMVVFFYIVTMIQLQVVISCPETCMCRNETCYSNNIYVDCSFSGLTSIPSDFPFDAHSIDLQHNNFSIVETGYFRNSSVLESMYLSNCKINVIQIGAFYFLSRLGYLDLGHNNIRNLSAYTFVGLGNLRQLNLEYNCISTLTSDAFDGLRHLNYLLLQNNEISTIENITFHSLPRLNGLYLGNNKISVIQPNSFIHLTNLFSLVLTNNSFIDVRQEYFGSLYSIREILMDKNNLTYIEPGTFHHGHHMPYLEMLTLDVLCDCSILWFWDWVIDVGKFESTIRCFNRNGAFLASLPICAFDICINETICPNNVCSNGGTCFVNSVGDQSCLCNGDWTGATCNVNPCHNNPCGMNGVCEVSINETATCQCNGNWSGQFCEQSPCETSMCNQSMCYYNDTGASICLNSLNFQCTEKNPQILVITEQIADFPSKVLCNSKFDLNTF